MSCPHCSHYLPICPAFVLWHSNADCSQASVMCAPSSPPVPWMFCILNRQFFSRHPEPLCFEMPYGSAPPLTHFCITTWAFFLMKLSFSLTFSLSCSACGTSPRQLWDLAWRSQRFCPMNLHHNSLWGSRLSVQLFSYGCDGCLILSHEWHHTVLPKGDVPLGASSQSSPTTWQRHEPTGKGCSSCRHVWSTKQSVRGQESKQLSLHCWTLQLLPSVI